MNGMWDSDVIKRKVFRKELLPAILISLFLGAALSASLADWFNPLIGTRTLPLQLTLIFAGPLLLAVLVLPAVGNLLRRRSEATTAAQRLAWSLALIGLVLLAAFCLILAIRHLSLLASLELKEIRKLQGTPSATQLPEMLFLVLVAILIGIPGTPLINRQFSSEKLLYSALVFLGLCFLAIYFINDVLPSLDTTLGVFHVPAWFEVEIPLGKDFRDGLFRFAQLLLDQRYIYSQQGANGNNYPPLMIVLALPYLLLGESAATLLNACLLFIANILCLSVAAVLARDYSLGQSGQPTRHANTIVLGLWLLVAFNLLSGYPFVFSLERGNIDIFAMLFATAAMWVLLRHPARIWWQVLLLSIAVHMKVYPIFLFAVLHLVNRSRIVLPAIVLNVALLLVAGPANALGFLGNVLYRSSHASLGVMNNSGFAFAVTLAQSFSPGASAAAATAILFTLIPLAIWAAAWFALVKIPNRQRAALSAFMITIPLMEVFPSVSFDYKLVILSTGILILLSKILMRMVDHQEFADLGQLLVLSLVALWIGRSYLLTPASLTLIQSKYPCVILLEVLMLLNIIQESRPSGVERAPLAARP